MTVTTVFPMLLLALLSEGGRVCLRATLLLLHIPEGRDVFLTLGDLLFMADDVSDGKNG